MSNQKEPKILFLLCFLTLAAHRTKGCDQTELPAKCTCQSVLKSAIMCTELSEFPSLPAGTKVVLLHSCKFPKIGGAIVPNYVGAQFIQITNSEITTIEDDAFQYLPNVNQLDLSGNAISNLSSNVFLDLPFLNQLSLSRNRLSILSSDLFVNSQNLAHLYLSYNEISSLPDDIFKSNAKLNLIDIAANKLSKIPTAIEKVSNLSTLNLASNPIGDLKANMFKNFKNLTTLDLTSCGINNIDDDAFAGLTELDHLTLDHNNLRHISAKSFAPMHKSLKRVWLENNQLTTLEEGTLPTGDALKELNLGWNPWHCDKNIAWLKDIPLQQINHENVTCKTPHHFEGLTLTNLTKEILEKEGNGIRSMLVAVIALPIIVICILIMFFLIYKIVLSRKTHASFRCKTPHRFEGLLLTNLTKEMLEQEGNGMRSMLAAAVALPIIAICVLIIFFIVYKIVQSRRQQKRASFRYSAVYRDTVESAHPPPKHRPVSEI